MKLIKYIVLIGSAIAVVTVVLLFIGILLFVYYVFVLSDWEECFGPLECYKLTCGNKWIPVEIRKVNVSNNRSVSLYYMDCGLQEISVPIHYEVLEAENVIVPMTYIEFYELNYVKQLTFKVVYAEDQSLVGIYDPNSSHNNPFAIIIDFKTGESWPGHAKVKAVDLVKRLQQENPRLTIPGFPPTPTPVPTFTPAKPTPTNTLVIQPTYYTPESSLTDTP